MWVKIEAQPLPRFSPFPLSKARMFNFLLLGMTQMFQNQSCQPIFLSFLQDMFHGEISTFHSQFEWKDLVCSPLQLFLLLSVGINDRQQCK